MLTKLLSGEQKTLRKYNKIVSIINRFEPEMKEHEDSELKEELARLKEEYESGKSLDDLLPKVFAIVREASRRALEQRHYDVQLIGGIALHQGRIAEMKTGEGKTLTATLPLILNSFHSPSQLITVNDYLASRDAEWMKPLYDLLGVAVGVISDSTSVEERKEAYQCDITYVTNSELGFDYLKDNLALDINAQVSAPRSFAIIDEIDNILIDEARTPLIISGAPEADSKETEQIYRKFAKLVRKMKGVPLEKQMNAIFASIPEERTDDFDYEFDDKDRLVSPSAKGIDKVEKAFGVENLYDNPDDSLARHFMQALTAEAIYKKDKDYAIIGGEVQIIDPHTGRIMEDRKWSDGLHQAIEAKENLKIHEQDNTQATITYQNFFRLYDKLGGMTGTARTEAAEFQKIYKLSVLPIPTNVPVIRNDRPDQLYKTSDDKWAAAIEEIKSKHETGQPILVGTATVEHSEYLSKRLKQEKINHKLLNAKPENAAREGEIIASAGLPGKVTIATNMAGRGVDIKLGSNSEEEEQVKELGGLFVIATERHESRRIDNQLRGRSGRQGDPGESVFFVSAEDDLIRQFAGDKLFRTIDRIESFAPGNTDGIYPEAIESKTLTKLVDSAQEKVEQTYFLERKSILEYDDVLTTQRKIIYGYRQELLEDIGNEDGTPVAELFEPKLKEFVDTICEDYITIESQDIDGLLERVRPLVEMSRDDIAEGQNDIELVPEVVAEKIYTKLLTKYHEKQAEIGSSELSGVLEAQLLLQVIDIRWQDHLSGMDELREGIHLRSFAQLEPLVAYQNESYEMFRVMMISIWEEYAKTFFNSVVTITPGEETEEASVQVISQ